MPTIQYTVRSVPPRVDRIVRKTSRLTGKSINQIIIDAIENTYLPGPSTLKGALSGLDWFVGKSHVDDDVMRALEEDDKIQKSLFQKELKKLDELSDDH
jgi:hypothetical protein